MKNVCMVISLTYHSNFTNCRCSFRLFLCNQFSGVNFNIFMHYCKVVTLQYKTVVLCCCDWAVYINKPELHSIESHQYVYYAQFQQDSS